MYRPDWDQLRDACQENGIKAVSRTKLISILTNHKAPQKHIKEFWSTLLSYEKCTGYGIDTYSLRKIISKNYANWRILNFRAVAENYTSMWPTLRLHTPKPTLKYIPDCVEIVLKSIEHTSIPLVEIYELCDRWNIIEHISEHRLGVLSSYISKCRFKLEENPFINLYVEKNKEYLIAKYIKNIYG